MSPFISTCRPDCLSILRDVLLPKRTANYKSVLIFGPEGCGKSSTVAHILSESPSRIIDCAQCHNERSFWVCACRAFGSEGVNSDQFLECTSESDTIVLDSVDRLPPHIISTFHRLPRHVVFVSHLPWADISQCSPSPLPLYVPHYSPAEMASILLCTLPHSQLSDPLVDVVVMTVADKWSRNLNHLIPATRMLYDTCIVPNRDKITPSVPSVWKVLEKSLVTLPRWIFLRTSSRERGLDLPRDSKLVLVCAFIASYNPSSSDAQYFLKNSSRKSRKTPDSAAQRGGPKLFELDRLSAIHRVIREQLGIGSTVDLNSQISTLASLRMVGVVGGLDSPKVRCLVSYDQVREVARDLNLEMGGYLYNLSALQ